MQKERVREGWWGVTGSRTGTGPAQIERKREKGRKRHTDKTEIATCIHKCNLTLPTAVLTDL